MLGVQTNPFHKANPFRLVQYQKFQHPHLPGQKQHDHHLSLYKDHLRTQPSKPLQNNWTFNQNNLDKKYDFSRKPQLTNSRVSDFELKMKMSNIGVPNKQSQKVVYAQEGRLSNPFYRKNLLVNKEEVMNQVELDVSLYRNKTRSSHESIPVTVTNIQQSGYAESPVVSRPRASISAYDSKPYPDTYGNESSPSANYSLGYSKTPEMTHRPSSRSKAGEQPEKEEKVGKRAEEQNKDQPACLVFKGRKFFLNDC